MKTDTILLFATRIVPMFPYGLLAVMLALYLSEAGLEDKIKEEIDRRLDGPLAGRFASGFNYDGSPYILLDQQAYNVHDSEYYQSQGYRPIWYYATNGLNNPMTQEDWENTMAKPGMVIWKRP